jgi:hypothetical protein
MLLFFLAASPGGVAAINDQFASSNKFGFI